MCISFPASASAGANHWCGFGFALPTFMVTKKSGADFNSTPLTLGEDEMEGIRII